MEISKINRFPIFDASVQKTGCHFIALPSEAQYLAITADEDLIILHIVMPEEITNLVGAHLHIFVEGMPIPTSMVTEAQQYLGHAAIGGINYHVFFCGVADFSSLTDEERLEQAVMYGKYSDILFARAEKSMRDQGNPNLPDPILPDSIKNLLDNL